MKLLTVTLALACAATCRAQSPKCTTPDTIFYNAAILTGVGLQPLDTTAAHPQHVQALSVACGRVLLTGTNAAILSQAVPSTEKIDLHGAFVVPGFNDAHTHMAFAGQQRLTVDLDNIPTLAAMQAAIKTYAATLPSPATWITGGGWDHTKWESNTLPTRQDLDAVTGAHPAYLERTDNHIAVLNTAALAAAGITASTPAPQGGQIDLDPATHEPTGIIRDAALALVRPHIPQPDAATRRRALQLSIDDALAHGVTSVQDFSTIDDFRVLMAMEDEGHLPLRFSEWMPFDLPIAQLKQYQALRPAADTYLHTAMLKGFMDGSLGSRTAALLAPYSDDPTNSGLPRYDQAKLNAMTVERAAAGFQIGFHAIGDRANAMALDAYTGAEKRGVPYSPQFCDDPPKKCTPGLAPLDPANFRFRIEHAQVLAPSDFARFNELGLIASMQPSHLLTDMAWAGDRLGPERSKYAYAWHSMLYHDVELAFGTDYPVESINPMRGLYAAVTRMNVEGTKTFEPKEKLSLNEALYAYTQGSAFAQFEEYRKGVLKPGFLADFAVLDRDITSATPQQLLHTRVLRTVVGGITRYTAPAATTDTPHHNTPDAD